MYLIVEEIVRSGESQEYINLYRNFYTNMPSPLKNGCVLKA
jgi:hypothetical protein